MATDEGVLDMTKAAPDPDAMTRIREGMRVVDDSGAGIGIVSEFKMGDPEAVTTDGQRTEAQGPVTVLGPAVTGEEPRVPGELAARLLRTGYIKIKTDGVIGRDAYAASDEIADVSGDVVTLAVGGDWLANEEE